MPLCSVSAWTLLSIYCGPGALYHFLSVTSFAPLNISMTCYHPYGTDNKPEAHLVTPGVAAGFGAKPAFEPLTPALRS